MSQGRVVNSIKNIIYKSISQIVSIILKFIGRSVFIHILGVEYLGINGLFSEILTVLSLADLGFGTAMVFSMYRPLAENNEEKLAQLVNLYKRIYTVIAIAIAVIGVLLLPFLGYLVNLESDIPHLRIYYLLYLANTVSSYLVVYKTCILTADQKNYLIARNDTIFNLFSTIGTTVILYITRSFMLYLILQVLFTYAKNFYCSHLSDKYYPYINKKVPKIPKEEAKDIFNNVKSVFIYKLSTTLIASTDNTLISLLISTTAVGYYSNYTMIINNVTLFINIFFSSITASIGNLIVQNNIKKNYQVYKNMQFISFILSSVSISTVYLIINDFINVWLGDTFVLDDLVVIAIVLNLYFSVVLMPIWSYREATGMYRQTKYIMVATAIVNLVLSIILGKLIGLAGILFATSISKIGTYFWYEPKLLFRQFFKEKVSKYYFDIAKNILITFVVVGISCFLFAKYTANSWLSLGIKTILVAVVNLIIVLILYGKNEEFKNLLETFKRLVHRT